MAWILSAFSDEAGASCEDQIAALQRANVRHIDIRSVDGHNISVLPVDAAHEVKKKLDDAGITVNMFGSPLGKIDITDNFEIDREKLRHMGELAPILGCNAIRIFSYYNKDKKPAAEFRAESLRRLEILKTDAKKLGLILYHENELGIYGERLEGVEVLAKALRDGKTFKLIFDFDNYNRTEDDVWRNWEALRDVTDAFHLKDSKDGLHVPIGQGEGRAREILNDARNRGWDGPVIVEPHLAHSAAVMATNVAGISNEEYAKMPLPDSFHAAVTIAEDLLNNIGAAWR
jgi:sugar phosphate isomerase/epimerase